MNNPHRNHSDEAPAQADAAGNLELTTARAFREEEMSDEDGGECHYLSFPSLEEIARNTRTKEDKGTGDRVELVAVEEPPIPRKYFRYIRRKKNKDTRKRRAGRTMSTGGRARATVEQTTPSSFLDDKNKIATRSVQARAAREGTRSDGCASDGEGGRVTANGVATAGQSLDLESTEDEPPLPPRRDEEDGPRVNPTPISGNTPPSTPGVYRAGGNNVLMTEDESSRNNVSTVVAYTVPEDPPLVPVTRIEDDSVDEGGANEATPEDPLENSTKWGVDFRNWSVVLIFLVMLFALVGLAVSLSVSLSGGGGESSSSPNAASTILPTLMPSNDPTAIASPTPSPDKTTSSSVPTKMPWVQPGTPWVQVGNDINGVAEDDEFGYSISVSENGRRLAMGAPNHDRDGLNNRGIVRIFRGKQEGDWKQLGDDLLGDLAGDLFGWSVSISGNGERVAVGARGHDGERGQVKVFQFESGNWNLLGSPLVGEAESDQFGWSVSLSFDGTIVAVSTGYNDGINGEDSGHVQIFQYASGSWSQLGNDIDGEAAGDYSGHSISLSSNGLTVAIGAPWNDGENGSGSKHGHVRVFSLHEGSWKQVGQDIDGEAMNDRFGYSVSLSANGNIVAVGAPLNDGTNGEDSGHVRIYKYDEGEEKWSQLGIDIDGEAAHDWSGSFLGVSLSSDGTVVAVGATHNGENGDDSGHIRIYKFDGNDWVQVGADIDGEAAGDGSGWSVSLSGDGNHVAIGAYKNIANGNSNSGHVRVYKSPFV